MPKYLCELIPCPYAVPVQSFLSKENAELRSQLGSKAEIQIMGLTYSQWKTHLQKNNLWDYVKDNGEELRGRFMYITDFEIREKLIGLGLLNHLEGNYILSEGGLMLLNNIEFEKNISS
ncbi:MAG TPA: hypothetical protein VFK06_02175 [Candidatus Angelobacter sp.]|nr:hypothetical protein [Candidatus Angelobacter sp.]